MQRLTFLIAFLALATLASTQTHQRALFLGNSYTYVNDLPGILRQLALAGGDTLTTDQNTPGGYTLQAHASNASTLNKIAQGNWDFVVIQEQSQRPSFSPSQVAAEVYPYAQALVDSIRADNPCAEPTFYMTWGRKYGDANNCAVYPPVCTYEGMQTRLRSSYLQMAVDNQATASPVGMAWWNAILQDSTLELYAADGSHPSYTGSYLAACVFYATFYRRSPLGLPWYGNLDSTTATFLQGVAEETVLDSLDQWQVGINDVQAAFGQQSLGGAQVQFTDSSTLATTWTWDFGDGATSTQANPQHTYSQAGTYTVTLIVGDGCTTDTLAQTVQITVAGAAEPREAGLLTWPQPTDGQLQIELPLELRSAPVDWSLSDPSGRTLATGTWPAGPYRHLLDLRPLPAGTYFLHLHTPKDPIVQKILVH